jgi:two-component system cell cycle sensor histidine kinase/response regulator CckA
MLIAMENNIKVLIIDDNPADRFLLAKDIIGRFRTAEIAEAESVEEAFDLIDNRQFDIILLDYYLRSQDGLELLEQFKSRHIEIPIIVITGRGDERIAVEAIKRGAKDYLNKDFLTSERLEITIKSILQNQERDKEKSELERKITEAWIRYQSIFEGAKEVIFICDHVGNLVDINPAGLRLFGYKDKSEILNRQFLSEISDEFGKEFTGKLSQIAVFQDYEMTMKNREGDKILALVTITATKNDSGILTGFQGIIHDLTEKKRMEDELFQMHKLESLGTIAGTIAHDFNNILSSILVNTEITSRYAGDNKMLTESARLIRESALRASALSQRLLGFAKKQEPDFRPVPIDNIIREAAEIVQNTANDRNITIKLPRKGENFIINGDKVQLGQLFLNLLINSIEAVPDRGRIEIECKPLKQQEAKNEFDIVGGSWLHIVLKDNGAGIDQKDLPNIFDPFFSTKRNKSMNVGLGLTSVMMVVKNHHGKMKINSAKGTGTEVHLAFQEISPAKKPS